MGERGRGHRDTGERGRQNTGRGEHRGVEKAEVAGKGELKRS